MQELQLIEIRLYGQIRPFGSALWLFIFGRSVFIYSAVRFQPSGPDSSKPPRFTPNGRGYLPVLQHFNPRYCHLSKIISFLIETRLRLGKNLSTISKVVVARKSQLGLSSLGVITIELVITRGWKIQCCQIWYNYTNFYMQHVSLPFFYIINLFSKCFFYKTIVKPVYKTNRVSIFPTKRRLHFSTYAGQIFDKFWSR